MLTTRDYGLMGGPHYKPKHPVDITEGVEMLEKLEYELREIRKGLEEGMFTYAGRQDIEGRLGNAELKVAYIQAWVWSTETTIQCEATEIYQTGLPEYVMRALVDAGYRTADEVRNKYKNYGSHKIPGIGRKGDQYIREWREEDD